MPGSRPAACALAGDPGLARRMLAGFALCLAQDDEQARRFANSVPRGRKRRRPEIGAAELPPTRGAGELRRQVGTRALWLAASTHTGEEDAAAEAHRLIAAAHPAALTIIAPRHPVRGETIAATLARRGLSVAGAASASRSPADIDIYLVDTLGELASFTVLRGSPLSVGHWSIEAGTTRSRRRASIARYCTDRL